MIRVHVCLLVRACWEIYTRHHGLGSSEVRRIFSESLSLRWLGFHIDPIDFDKVTVLHEGSNICPRRMSSVHCEFKCKVSIMIYYLKSDKYLQKPRTLWCFHSPRCKFQDHPHIMRCMDPH